MSKNPVVATARAFALAGFLAGAAGCAALDAPVHVDVSEAPATQTHALHIEPVEGRPNGLVLRFSCTCSPPEDAWLEVLRRQGADDAQIYRSVRLSEELSARLTGEGFQFLDRSITPQPTYYQLRLRASRDDTPADVLAESSPVLVRWQKPPTQPAAVRATSVVSGAVELRWQAPPGAGALIFRRNVLDPNAPLERLSRVGPAANGLFVDRQLEPAGVYAYRVALAIQTDTTVQFGRPSDEIYVTVHTAPSGGTARQTRQSGSGS